MRGKKISDNKKLSCMVALKLTPGDYKRFLRAVKREKLKYATELLRKIALDYLGGKK